MAMSKRNSVILMITFATFLAFMDIKDLYYKIAMTGPARTLSFTFNFIEHPFGVDLTKLLLIDKEPRVTPSNMWNAFAERCDSLMPSQLLGVSGHISSVGTNCTIDKHLIEGKHLMIPTVSIDHVVWIAGIMGDVLHKPMPSKPYTAMIYANIYGVAERQLRRDLADTIKEEDAEELLTLAHAIFRKVGSRMDVWDNMTCVELVSFPEEGGFVEKKTPIEYACIWTDDTNTEVIDIHIDERMGVYFRYMMESAHTFWQQVEFFYVGSSYIRTDLRCETKYSVDRRVPSVVEEETYYHYNTCDVAVTGVLYYLMIFIEVLIIYINIGDSCTVAYGVVQPLILGSTKSVYSIKSSNRTKKTTIVSSAGVEESGRSQHRAESTKESAAADDNKATKNEALSRVLLYTDLSSVSFYNKFLCVLIFTDAFLSWIYIAPNSTILTYSDDWFQVISAILSTFRVWPITVILVNFIWRYTIVLMNERVAALITEHTYITAFEAMTGTLLGVWTELAGLQSIVLILPRYNGNRFVQPTLADPLVPFSMSYSAYKYGDLSYESEMMSVFFTPLINVLGYSILYSYLMLFVKGIFYVYMRKSRNNLSIGKFWRTYERNSIEVIMNDPMRAKAIVRSQYQMSYTFGRSVYIRPFVYLEQNYYIHDGYFQQRPTIPLVSFDSSSSRAKVNTKAYQIEGVVRDDETNKLRSKRNARDNQIPLS